MFVCERICLLPINSAPKRSIPTHNIYSESASCQECFATWFIKKGEASSPFSVDVHFQWIRVLLPFNQ